MQQLYKLKKKGVSYLAVTALTAIILLVLVGVLLNINRGVELLPERYQCIYSVVSKNIVNKIDPSFSPDIKCPAVDLKLDKNDAIAKRQLAEEMRYCWEALGKGKYDLAGSSGIYCHVCAYVNVEESAKDNIIKDFDKYLAETNIKGKDENYLSYFMTSKEFKLESQNALEKIEETVINQNKQKSMKELNFSNEYFIVFLTAKDTAFIKYLTDQLGTLNSLGIVMGGTAVVAGVVTGTIVFPIVLGAAAGGASTWAILADKKEDKLSSILLIEATPTEVGALGCQYMLEG